MHLFECDCGKALASFDKKKNAFVCDACGHFHQTEVMATYGDKKKPKTVKVGATKTMNLTIRPGQAVVISVVDAEGKELSSHKREFPVGDISGYPFRRMDLDLWYEATIDLEDK